VIAELKKPLEVNPRYVQSTEAGKPGNLNLLIVSLFVVDGELWL
jgi:hypothetical protein